MTPKSPRIFLLGLVLFGLLFTTGTVPAAKDYLAEEFNVSILARQDGSILVTEMIVFRFMGGPFTYVSRELPTDYTDGITGFTSSVDGKEFPVGEGNGFLEIRGKDPIRLTWHFSPLSDSTHTFILNYRVLGITRVEETFDLLLWNAVPFDHPYPIQTSTVQIIYPRRAKLFNTPEASFTNTKIKPNGSQVLFVAKNLKEDEGQQVSLRFIRNSLISEPPIWQSHQANTNKAIARILPWGLGIFAILLILGIGTLYLIWEQNANLDRGESIAPANISQSHAPPNDMHPAFAGSLASNRGRASWSNALATLLDLARQGVIKIGEAKEKRWFHQQGFYIQLCSRPENLNRFERGLLDLLFESKRGPRTSVTISEMSNSLPYRFRMFSEPLILEMEAAGLLSARRQAIGKRVKTVGIALLLSSLVVFTLTLITGGVSALGENWMAMNISAITMSISGSAILVSLTAIILADLYSPLTEKGLQEAGSWRLYSDYLKDVTREREPVSRPDLFENALPYAASFGLAEDWSKFFHKRGEVRIPTWFQALSVSGDGDSMTAFVVMLAVSSSASSSGGAGAGAAGGGSSSAG